MSSHIDFPPSEVIAELEKHLLLDGFRIVIDLERSRGCRLVDAVSGRQLLDLYGFYGSLPVGFNHPHFKEPAVEKDLLAAARTKVANSDVYSVPYARFVKTFHRVVGLAPLERYFFIDGGALAVENALKAAMDWKVRKNLDAGRGERGTEIMHLERAFHGRSGYTMSLTNTDPRKTQYFAKFDWPRILTPCLDFSVAQPERTQRVITLEKRAEAQIRQVLERKAVDIAAIIIEPIQGEGGDNHFRGEWFQTLRRICDENEMLLIYDEVQSGMGITGRTWCCEHFGALPDLLVFGKKAQVCGVMAGPRLDEVKDNCFRLSSRINSTWGSNLTDMVRSTHYLHIVEEEKLVANAAATGRALVTGLTELSEKYPIITGVRGRGLMIAFDLPDKEAREEFYRGLFETGLLGIRSGERALRFRPVLDITLADVAEALDLIGRQCRRSSAVRKAEGVTANLAPIPGDSRLEMGGKPAVIKSSD